MPNQRSTNFVVVTQSTPTPNQQPTRVAFFTETGAAFVPLTTPGATQADVAALTSATITGGESPTEAEHNQLRADLVATRTVLNSLLAKLRTAGIILT